MAKERNGRKPRREFVKQSVATLGTMGALGGTAGAAPPGAAEPGAPPSARRAWNGEGQICWQVKLHRDGGDFARMHLHRVFPS